MAVILIYPVYENAHQQANNQLKLYAYCQWAGLRLEDSSIYKNG